MDVVFLDANVLFSAAYRPDAGIRKLWDMSDVRLVTSVYAAEEARRNLDRQHRDGLEELLEAVELVSDTVRGPDVRLPAPGLPDKDLPILFAAVRAGATHLVTGDIRHFGLYYGQKTHGVLVASPAEYFVSRQP